MGATPRRGRGAVLVAALVVLAAAAVFAAPGAAAAGGADGDRIHVDDDWSDAEQSPTVGDGYVLGENATASIQAAVDLAGDGDTIVVHEGAYGSVRVTDHAVDLRAADGATPEISGDGAAVVQFEGSTDGASVRGFELTGDATLGVEVRANDVTVEENDISVGSTGVQVQDDADGSGAATGTLVADNTITGGAVGVSVNGGDTVTDNTVTGATQEGIGVAGDGNDLAGNDALVPDGDAPAVQFHGDYDEVAEANALLADDAVDEVAFHDSDRVYDGAVVANDTVYATVQQAVDAAQAGATVEVAAGTYTEQVHVEKNLTVVGAGEGETTIESPATLSESFTKPSGDTGYPVVLAENADVDLESLTVDGANNGDDNHEFYGVVYSNASGAISETTVRDVMNAQFSGAQHGIAVAAYNDDGRQRTVTLDHSTLVDYQKGGLVASGSELTARVIDNEITGQGPTDVTAQNGVQISGAAAAVIEGNVVSGNEYTSDGWLATNVLVYGASESQTTTIRNNDISDGTAGLAVGGSANVDIADNDFANHTWHVTDYTERVDVGAVFETNAFDAAAYTENASGGAGESVYSSVQMAVDAASNGDTVHLSEGTYDLSDYENERLDLDTSGVTIQGESMDGVVLDGTDSPWPVYASNQSDLTLRNFTLAGTEDSGSDDGLKVAFTDGLTVENVAVEGSAGNELDLNNVRNATLRDVHAVGQETGGVGVALTAVRNATLDGVETSGNTWGGVGLYDVADDVETPTGWTAQQNTTDVTITEASTLTEAVPLYSDQEFGGTLGDVDAPAYEYAAENPTHRDRGSDFQFFFQDREAAVEWALAVPTTENSVIQELSEDAELDLTDTYLVADGMSARTAVEVVSSGGEVLLLNGTHELQTGLDLETDGVTVRGESRAGTTLDASAVPGRAIETPSDSEVTGVTVAALTVVGPQQDESGNYALKFQPTTEDVTVRNVHVEDSDETGIDFNGVDGVTVADTTVENTSANGVALTDTRNVTIRNATLTGNDWGGVALYTSGWAAEQGTYNVTVADSTITDTGLGVYAQNGEGITEPFDEITVRDTTFANTGANVVGDGDDDLAWFDYDAVLAANDFDRAVTVRADDGSIAAPVVGTTVQTGVEAADAGETVALEPGTYPTNATLSKPVTLTGPGADASESARLVPDSPDQGRILTLNASDVTVEDLVFDGEEGAVTAVGFWSEDEYASDATIRANSFEAVDYGVYLYSASGEVSSGSVVAENTFENVDERAVILYNNAYASVVDNEMTDVRIGVQTGNHWQGAGDADPSIAGNDVDARDLGVFHNLQYQDAANWTVADNDLSGGQGVLLTSISGDRTATVTNNTITDVETGLTAWNLDTTAGVVVSDLTVDNATTAVNVTDVDRYGTGDVALSLRGLTVTDAETGVLATDANATAGAVTVGIFESTVAADTGLRVTGDADVTAEYVDLAGSGLAVNETGTASVDADLNHFGEDPASAVAGNVTYDPFLTAPPSETSGDAGTLQQFGHDFAVPGDGEAYAVGFPGDVDGTLGEVFGEFDGAVYRWDAAADEWVVPDADTPVEALDAVVVVAEERVTYTVDYADASPPGAPGETGLDAGWNFVAAPLSGPVETAFGATSGGDVVRVVSAITGPASQPYGLNASTFGTYTPDDSGLAVAGGGPTVSPFTGYWVYASDDGALAGATYPGITLGDELAALDADGAQSADRGEA